jgi:hypothetical protein
MQPLASDEAWVFLDSRLRSIQTIVAPRAALPQGEALAREAQQVAARLGVSLFNTFLTAFSGMVLFLLTRRLTRSERAAWGAALAWGAGSLAWPHARTFFSEAFAGLCQLLAFLALACCFVSKEREEVAPETPLPPSPTPRCGTAWRQGGRQAMGVWSDSIPSFFCRFWRC